MGKEQLLVVFGRPVDTRLCQTVGKLNCKHSTMRPTLALQIGKIYSNTTQWLGRTVMVQGNDVEQAMNVLNGIMANEGMVKRFKLTRRYEKPKYARSRINFERNKAIYNEDMDNRIKLMLRKNRKDPYPGNTC